MDKISADVAAYNEYLDHLEASLPERDRDVYRCPLCRDTGWISDGTKAVPCKCQRSALLAARRRQSSLPAKLQRCRLANFSLSKYSTDLIPEGKSSYRRRAEQALELSWDFVRVCKEGKTPRRGLLLIGPAGCGKTHLAAGIANELTAAQRDMLFLVVPEFLDQLRDAYRQDRDSASMLERKAFDTPVLILDDLGAHNFTDWVRNKLFSLINYRVNHDLPCIVTTNLNLQALDENIGDRISSRLVENCVTAYLSVAEDIRFTLRPSEVR